MKYVDEKTWEELNPERVAEGERVKPERFQKMGVCDYETREVAMNDELGKFLKVKWVWTNKGTCRLFAQELVYGHRMDDLFAGTPSLMAVRLILHDAAKEGRGQSNLSWCWMRRVLSCTDRSADESAFNRTSRTRALATSPLWVVLSTAMYGTRDAPQM